MAEVIVTEMQLILNGFDQQINKATASVEGYAKAAESADKANTSLSGSSGSAAKKTRELAVAADASAKKLKDVGDAAGKLGSDIGETIKQTTGLNSTFGQLGTSAINLGRTIVAALGPVGLAITAVVGAFVALGKIFFDTERGSDALGRAVSVVSTVFQALLGIAQQVAFTLVDTFSNPKQAVIDLWNALKENIVNRITGLADQFKFLGEIIAGVFTLDTARITAGVKGFGESTVQALTGVDNLAGKVANGFNKLGTAIVGAAKDGDRIFQIGEELEDLAIRRAKEEARLNRTIEEQLAIARDVNQTSAARKAAAEEAIKAQDKLAGLSKQQAQLELERLLLQQKQNDTNAAGLLERAKLEAQVDQIEADRLAGQRRTRAIISGIDKANADAAIANAKKVAEEQAKATAEREQAEKAAAEKAAKEAEAKRLAIIKAEQQANEAIDKLREERELAALSGTERAIAEARIRAQKEVEITGQLFDNLEKLAEGDADRIIEIRAQQAEAIGLIEEGLVEKIAEIRKIEADKDEAEAQKELDRIKAQEQERLGIVAQGAEAVSAVVGGLADGSIKSAEDASKALIGIALDTAEKLALVAIANATGLSLASPESIATAGAAGIAKAAIIAALIKGAFGLLKSQLAGSFYEGGIVGVDGGTKMHSGRDGYIARVHKGEHIMPTDMTKRYMPYLEMMRDGKFEQYLNSTAALNLGSTTSTATLNDRRIVGALGSVGSLSEQRKQTALLAMVAQGLNRGRNVRYAA
jgi:hypothetical protein